MKKYIKETTMKKQYDFSKGVKAKFYTPQEDMQLPVYLDKTNHDYFFKLAREKNVAVSKLVNFVLTKERELIDEVVSK